MSIEDKLYNLLKYYEKSPDFFRKIIARLYNLIPESKRLGENYTYFKKLINQTEYYSLDDMHKYQNEQFLKTIEYAKKTEFYPKYYKENGIDINEIKSLDDIIKLPFITKDILKSNTNDMIVQKNKSKKLYMTSGGSTGVPVGFYLEKNVSRPKELAFMEDQWSKIGYKVGDRCAVIRGGVISSISQGAISKTDYFRNWLILSSYHMTDENLPKYINLLNKFKPKFIQGYPSALFLLSKFMKKNKIKFKFNLKGVLAGSENLYDYQKEEFKEVFGCRTYSWYGHAERVLLGGYCEKEDLYHIFPQYGYAEVIDTNGNLIDSGKGEIVGTSFHNSVMPLIRYKSADLVSIANSQKCVCKRNYLILNKIEGRLQELILTSSDRKISMTALNMHSNIFDNIKQFQFEQWEKGKVVFNYIEANQISDKERKKIYNELMQKLGNDIELTLKKVDNIPLTKSGKHRFLIQNLKI